MAKLACVIGLVVAVFGASGADAEPVKCQKDVVKSLLKLKKTYLKKVAKCVDNQNLGKIPGPCPDAVAQLKIQTTRDKVIAKIALSCPDPDLATLGFPATCDFGTTQTGIEADCAALPVSTPTEFATCLACWKEAQLAEFIATLYASHAVEVCGGSLQNSSACSDLDCTAPLPDQRDLGDSGENDCQKAIGKAGVKHLVQVEKVFEKCGLAGGTRASCEADLVVQAAIDKAELKLETLIKNKCGNRDPVPSTPWCCRTGVMNQCTALPATREDCLAVEGQSVQENKVCGGGNTCDNAPGGQKLTWWSTCPRSDTCPGTALTTLEDLIECVDESADEIAQHLLCIQFPSGWECPDGGSPSLAFLD